jgi:hypothetical protein
MRTLYLALSLCITPALAFGADKWVQIEPTNSTAGTILINIGRVQINKYGNPVTTIRSELLNGVQMDIVTEFDCTSRRTRALSSAATDKEGHLLTAGDSDKQWFTEEQSIGLKQICR